MSCVTRLAFVVCNLLGFSLLAAKPEATLIPWLVPEADCRQVLEVSVEKPRKDLLVEMDFALPEKGSLAILDSRNPENPLPFFRSGARISFLLPGILQGKTRIMLYHSNQKLAQPSPVLPAPPLSGDDYAQTAHGDAWDFDEGDQDGIRGWGNRPGDYGEVTVANGVLKIPVTGDDPYCIWGIMFGNPEHQPTGNKGTEAEKIDSSIYSTLRIRLRQSCKKANWMFFFTDNKGNYRHHKFTVRGSEFQTVEFDLPKLFPAFWDGRIFRAFRLDTTDKSRGTTVEIDWVRLERTPPQMTVGPLLTRQQNVDRGQLRSFKVKAPKTVLAGEKAIFQITVKGKSPFPPSPLFLFDLKSDTGDDLPPVLQSAGGLKQPIPSAIPVGSKARKLRWSIALVDDLGRATGKVKKGKLNVKPAPLDHYDLQPEKEHVPVSGTRRTRIAILGADTFGNTFPTAIKNAKISSDNGGIVELDTRKSRAELLCSQTPLTRHTITLKDEQGISGACTVETIAYRKNKFTINQNGYITLNGATFFPLGGFYANWPSKLPDENGRIVRAVDLFPCGNAPYTCGYPWQPEVEKSVCDYLDLCRKNGVTTLRLMLRNMDLVGRVDQLQLKAVLHLFDLARERELYFNLVLFEDYTKPPYGNRGNLEKIVLPHYTPEELAALPPHRARFLVEKDLFLTAKTRYWDADAIRCQKDYLDELIPVMAGREEVFCYELENEMVQPPMSWCREIAAHIRSLDPYTPILGNPNPHTWPEPPRWRTSSCDLFSPHPYNDGRDQNADHGAVVYVRSKWSEASTLPFFTGEGGINQSRWQKDVKDVGNDQSMRGIRDMIWLSMACGANGSLMWTAFCESEKAEFGKVPKALKALELDIAAIERRRPQLVMVMPDSKVDNAQACRLSYQLLAKGIDFDTRLAADAKGYKIQIEAKATSLPEELKAEFFEPGKGWQAATLVAENKKSALVYLRNVAGGVINYGGKKRACWLRNPQPAIPELRIVGGKWTQIRIVDLDTMKLVEYDRHGDQIIVPEKTSHDLLISLQK